ncbi:hypothetical protein Y1Q_0017061 [Alligator mississippiensis]|uniref:Uncharacterized protein n=1 Tax=Alligator mississippiensis TaxID=8496 RepID=A0A151NDK5_ALLMI|nr:hypothetical protein Y1Q_0017061 [Alligator mississippiensis]
MTVVQAYVCDTHHHCLSSPGILPPTVLDLLVQAVAINSAYTSKVLDPCECMEAGVTGPHQQRYQDLSEAAEGLPRHVGNKTECALLGLVLGRDPEMARAAMHESALLKVYTFNSVRKAMSSVMWHPGGAGYCLYSKGAAEILLRRLPVIPSPYSNPEPTAH